MAKLDGVWAQHVWRSPDGNEHPQWSGPDDPRLCRCGERHKLADAPARLICPGVAHYEGVRPCVLCGLGWRMPAVAQIDAPVLSGAGVIPGDAPGVILMDPDAPPPARPARCVYCMTLEDKPLVLARHRVQAHPGENR